VTAMVMSVSVKYFNESKLLMKEFEFQYKNSFWKVKLWI